MGREEEYRENAVGGVERETGRERDLQAWVNYTGGLIWPVVIKLNLRGKFL